MFPNFVGGSSHATLSEESNFYQALRENGVSNNDANIDANVELVDGTENTELAEQYDVMGYPTRLVAAPRPIGAPKNPVACKDAWTKRLPAKDC